MKFSLPLASLMAVMFIVSCDNDSTSDSTQEGDRLADIDSVELTGDSAMPSQMAIVPPLTTSPNPNSLARSLSTRSLHDTSTYAPSSAYASAQQNVYVGLDAIEPIKFVDNFLCFTEQTRPLLMKNQGNYLTWNDAGRCFNEEDGSSQQEGNSDEATRYVSIVAHVSQENDASPLILKGWVEDYAGQSGEEGGPSAIKLKGEVSQTPTDANPFGVFSLTYGLLPTIASNESENTGFGEVSSSKTSDGSSSFTLYQKDAMNRFDCESTASVDYNDSTRSGLARTSRSCIDRTTGQPAPYGNMAYALAVNAQYVHVAQAPDYPSLTDPSTQTCFIRDDITEVSWRYQLFNREDGSDVLIRSGMQLKVDADGEGTGADANGFESWGHIGYQGSWREDGEQFENNEVVQQATWDGSVGDRYTVKVAPGRLVKNTIESVNLSDLQGVTFTTWVNENDTYLLSAQTDLNGNASTNDSLHLVVQPNTTSNGFEVVGIQEGWGDTGPNITTLSTAVPIVLNANVSLKLWSNQLGGSVQYTSGSSVLRLFARSYVNGSETNTGELFSNGDNVNLVCLERCLKDDISAEDVNVRNGVFETNAFTQRNYDFSRSNLTLVNDGGTNAIGFADGVTPTAIENSVWSWGLETGPMVVEGSVTDAADFYSKIEAGTLMEFYIWETGLNSWQQQVVLVDENGSVVQFDKPIAFQYTHDQMNDRNNSSSHAGKVYLLKYGGKGRLQGLPVNADTNRWTPELSLKDGTVLGNANQYVIKALDVEQRMTTTDMANCESLPLNSPSQPIPTDIVQDVFSIGDMPDIGNQPPAVIDGELVD